MNNGSLCETCLSFCYHGSTLGNEDMEGGRPVCAVIDGRALNDFMFYIYYAPVCRLNS